MAAAVASHLVKVEPEFLVGLDLGLRARNAIDPKDCERRKTLLISIQSTSRCSCSCVALTYEDQVLEKQIWQLFYRRNSLRNLAFNYQAPRKICMIRSDTSF